MSTITFKSGWFTQARVISILNAPVNGLSGSAERIQFIELLRGLAIEGAFVKSVEKEVIIPTAWLRAWAMGAINGWKQETVMTQAGALPLTDGDRNIIRLSCKALKVWEFVCPKLPTIEDDKDFSVDQFDEDEDLPQDPEEEIDGAPAA